MREDDGESLRLLFVSHSFPPPDCPMVNLGRMQRVATDLHRTLERRPDVQLSSLVLRSSSRWTPVRTALFLPKVWWTIRHMAKRREIDAVLFSSLATASLTAVMHRKLRRCGIRTFAIAHGDDVILPVRIYQRLLPHVFAALDAVLPVSRATGQACLDRGATAEKVFVIPNGIDPQRFASAGHARQPRDEMRAVLGLPNTYALPQRALLLCSTGRHVARKGFAWFVDRVMPLLPENVHYWIIGRGPETDNIRAAVTRRGLEGRVCLLGRLSDKRMEAVYRSADLYVMPNVPVEGTMEGFGVVILEAGMCGLPTIGSRLEGIEDVIGERENGHLVESGNARAFADMVTSYDRNRSALDALAGRTIPYTKQFAWDVLVDRHLGVIREVLGA